VQADVCEEVKWGEWTETVFKAKVLAGCAGEFGGVLLLQISFFTLRLVGCKTGDMETTP
jgi:hypothetical protein